MNLKIKKITLKLFFAAIASVSFVGVSHMVSPVFADLGRMYSDPDLGRMYSDPSGFVQKLKVSFHDNVFKKFETLRATLNRGETLTTHMADHYNLMRTSIDSLVVFISLLHGCLELDKDKLPEEVRDLLVRRSVNSLGDLPEKMLELEALLGDISSGLAKQAVKDADVRKFEDQVNGSISTIREYVQKIEEKFEIRTVSSDAARRLENVKNVDGSYYDADAAFKEMNEASENLDVNYANESKPADEGAVGSSEYDLDDDDDDDVFYDDSDDIRRDESEITYVDEDDKGSPVDIDKVTKDSFNFNAVADNIDNILRKARNFHKFVEATSEKLVSLGLVKSPYMDKKTKKMFESFKRDLKEYNFGNRPKLLLGDLQRLNSCLHAYLGGFDEFISRRIQKGKRSTGATRKAIFDEINLLKRFYKLIFENYVKYFMPVRYISEVYQSVLMQRGLNEAAIVEKMKDFEEDHGKYGKVYELITFVKDLSGDDTSKLQFKGLESPLIDTEGYVSTDALQELVGISRRELDALRVRYKNRLQKFYSSLRQYKKGKGKKAKDRTVENTKSVKGKKKLRRS